MHDLEIDHDVLIEFEGHLDPSDPEQSEIPCRVLGYGEISTVFEIQTEELEGLAVKRMSIFENPDELLNYLESYDRYHGLLENDIGIPLPDNGYFGFRNPLGRPIFYIIQRKIPASALGNNLIHQLHKTDGLRLFQLVISKMEQVWAFNRQSEGVQVAIDGQISNWALSDDVPEESGLDPDAGLVYIDTSTPLFQVNDEDQLDPELFLRSAPSFLAWIIRSLFLDEVMARYYDPRKVLIDLIANLYKEGKPDLIPDLVNWTNSYLPQSTWGLAETPITEREIRAYYRQDALIWSLYSSMRRLDKFIHRYLLRQDYPYILPGPVQR